MMELCDNCFDIVFLEIRVEFTRNDIRFAVWQLLYPFFKVVENPFLDFLTKSSQILENWSEGKNFGKFSDIDFQVNMVRSVFLSCFGRFLKKCPRTGLTWLDHFCEKSKIEFSGPSSDQDGSE